MSERDATSVVGFIDALELLAPKLAKAANWFVRNQEVIFNLLGQIFAGKLLEDAGWLPHPALVTIKSDALQASDFRQAVEDHYRGNWAALRSELVASVSRAAVDQRATEVFGDAIALHEQGQYRAVCRLIFPELERVVRQLLMQKRRGTATKLRELRERLGQLPASEHTSDPGKGSLYIFAALEMHLFEDIDSDETLRKFEASGIPNRHACVHGLIDYNTYQNSLNMLILADYCFSAIGRLRTTPQATEIDQHER